MRCFLDSRRVGAVVCCPRRLSLCTMHLPEARFGPSVRRGLGADRPSWLRGHGCGLGPESLRVPNPASLLRRTRREGDLGAGDPQQSSMAEGARGSPYPVCPLESRGPGAKTAYIAFLSRGALGLLFAARGDFPFAECSCQKLVWGRRCDGASALCGRAGSGGMAGAWAQKAFPRPILLPHEGEPVGSGFRAPETPSKAAGPREPVQPSPGWPYGERRAGGENGLRCFLDPRRVGAVGCCPRRVSLCKM